MNHKYRRIFLTAITAAALIFAALPAQAANTAEYRIEITDSDAATTQELVFEEHSVAEGDTVNHKIYVDNRTSNAHLIKLKNIEVIEDSILLDKLAFEFVNGGTVVPFREATIAEALNKELFIAAKSESGAFMLNMTVDGNLTNEYQNTSVTLRYTFEIINLYSSPGDGGNAPNTGDDSGRMLVLYSVTCIASLLCILLLLFGKRRKKDEEEDSRRKMDDRI